MSESEVPERSQDLTRCRCVLDDCYFYNPVDEPHAGSDACDCAHPEKHFHPGNPCPLYRKDWQGGKEQDIKDLKSRFRRRRGLR